MAKKYNVISPKDMKYWQERIAKRDKKYLQDVKKLEAQLKKEYVKAKKEIKTQIDAFYANLDSVDLTEAEKNRLEDTIRAINRNLDELFQKEENLLTQALIDKYRQTDEDISSELGISFSNLPEIFIREAIAQNWSGLTYSERIWDNHRAKLGKEIKEQLKAGLIRGDSLQDISRIIEKRFGVSLNDAFRLIRTEMNWVINQATINNYKENGIKEYQFMAFIDHRTSTVCKSRDGEVISVDEAKAGSNLPPLHPH